MTFAPPTGSPLAETTRPLAVQQGSSVSTSSGPSGACGRLTLVASLLAKFSAVIHSFQLPSASPPTRKRPSGSSIVRSSESCPSEPSRPLPSCCTLSLNFATGCCALSTTRPFRPAPSRSTSCRSFVPGVTPSARARSSTSAFFSPSASVRPAGRPEARSVNGPLPSPPIVKCPSASAVALPSAPSSALMPPRPAACERSKESCTSAPGAGLPSANATVPATLLPARSTMRTPSVTCPAASSISCFSLERKPGARARSLSLPAGTCASSNAPSASPFALRTCLSSTPNQSPSRATSTSAESQGLPSGCCTIPRSEPPGSSASSSERVSPGCSFSTVRSA